jgi:putative transposase
LVDTLGLIWGLAVVAGNMAEAAGAKLVFGKLATHLPRWEVVWVDGGYEHRIEEWVEENCSFRIEVVKRDEGRKGWQLLPKRWVVERTYGWLNHWRGLAKEYDYCPRTSEAKILLAMCRLMLRRPTV